MENKPKKPGWRDVARALTEHNYEKAELLGLLGDLYKLSGDNRDFFHARFSLGEDPLAAYKKIIDAAMFPDVMKDGPLLVRSAKQAIARYEKAVGDPHGRIELMLFFVERGQAFSREYGYEDGAFFVALERMFERAATLAKTLDAEAIEPVRARMEDIVDAVSDWGWGHYDALRQTLDAVFPDVRE